MPAVEEYAGAVGRVHSRECAAADIRERVDIGFGDEWTRDGVTISGELLLDQRHPGPPVGIDDAVGNVIFTLHFEDGAAGRAGQRRRAERQRAGHDQRRSLRPARAGRGQASVRVPRLGDRRRRRVRPARAGATGAARAALEDLFATC